RNERSTAARAPARASNSRSGKRSRRQQAATVEEWFVAVTALIRSRLVLPTAPADMSLPPPRPADWQLPEGVNRGLWDYLHNSGVALGYDAGLAGASLCAVDQSFVEKHYRAGGRLLDLGCGTGRLVIALAGKGLRPV